MSNQPIENLKITNFKCFKDLEVSNIGRVNLIGGKNNVGKTAFLEAVELFVSSNEGYDVINSINKILKRRQGINQSRYFEIDFIYDDEIEIAISSLSKICTLKRSIGIIDRNNIKGIYEDTLPTEILSVSVNADTQDFPVKVIGKSEMFKSGRRLKSDLIYISTSKAEEQDIAIYFGSLTELSLESFLNNSLSLFDDNILELKPIPKENGIVLKLKLKNKKQLVLLSSLGEGINRYIAILCAIWASKDSVLLIDEIENGIHYTNYKKLWKIIFQASVDANCQIFITTHSKECIGAFNEVQLENETCNAQYFEFYRHLKKDLIVASAIDKERLQYSLTHEGRVRGE
jgi:AAA15 family ATPase/GTPase